MSQSRTAPHDLDRDPRYQLAKRISQSTHFQKAPRLREFLLFICEQTILNQTDNLTEQKLGQRIFERRADYSPADDSIVRVQARQLRLRLAEYFHGEGRDEKSTIEIPKGSYAAVFHEGRATYDPEPEPLADASSSRVDVRWAAACGVGLALAAVCVYLFVQNERLSAGAVNSQGAASPPPWVLDRLFDKTQPTTVIFGDPAFGNIQGMLDRELSLEDYLRPGYPQSILPDNLSVEYRHAFRTFTASPISSFAQVVAAERLGRVAGKYGWQFTSRHARDVTIRDLARGNLILFGSRMSNPWIELYDKALNFQSNWDKQAKVVYFRNTSPLAGERPVYASAGPNGVPGSAFAVVALLPGSQPSSERCRVLTVRGTKAEAIEAAWDLITDAPRLDQLLTGAGFRVRDVRGSQGFEMLVETRALGDSHGDVAVRSVRLRR